MTDYVGQALSRHFVVRHDYGAYEYTTYVYRSPSASDQRVLGLPAPGVRGVIRRHRHAA